MKDSARPVALALDLGGTNVRVAVVSLGGEMVLSRRELTHAEHGPDAVIQRMVGLVRGAQGDLQERRLPVAVALGVAAPGPLLPATGIVVNAPNLPGWDHVPLADELGRQLGLPTFVHNDARLAALAEAVCGAGRGRDPMVYLTLSTGVGGGVVSGGRLEVGHRGLAGELGHMIIRDGGPACALGHPGCVEGLVSGSGIAARARALAVANGRESAWLAHAAAPSEAFAAQTVFAAARAGDTLALGLVRDVASDLGALLANIVNIFDPARIVLGGGVSAAWDDLSAVAMGRARDLIMAWPERDFDVVPAELGDHAGLVGAGLYALERQGVSDQLSPLLE